MEPVAKSTVVIVAEAVEATKAEIKAIVVNIALFPLWSTVSDGVRGWNKKNKEGINI